MCKRNEKLHSINDLEWCQRSLVISKNHTNFLDPNGGCHSGQSVMTLTKGDAFGDRTP